MATSPKPIKITGTATGASDKATNYKDTQKISKVPTRVSAGIKNPEVQPAYRETGIKITGTATGTKIPTAAQVNAATKNGMSISKRAGSK